MSEVLVTGVNGFVGGHLAQHLYELGHLVYGAAREIEPNDRTSSFLSTYTQCDMLDVKAVNKLSFRGVDAIVHLAGLASVGQSFEMPHEYMLNNGAMVDNLLSHAFDSGFSGRAIIVSTGALYNPHQPMPINESGELSKNSPYAVGKLLAENVAEYYRGRGHDVIVVRPFNHIGPGQGEGFLLPDLYNQILKVKNKESEAIFTGNLSTERDYTDVRDIVAAYALLATADSLNHEIYNICSGKSVAGRTILDNLLTLTNSESAKIEIDKTKIRPNDTQIIVGDSSRIQKELGWHPIIPLEQTIDDFVRSQS